MNTNICVRIHWESILRRRPLSFSPFVSPWHPHSQSAIPAQPRSHPQHPSVTLVFIRVPSILIIHPSTRPYFILTSLAPRIQSRLRTLRWFKSITLGDRKTLLRCSDWGLLKFISCGIRPEIKKKKEGENKQLYGWRAEWCIWMSMCVCVLICQVFMKKKVEVSKESETDKCSVIPWAFLNYLYTSLFLLVLLVFSSLPSFQQYFVCILTPCLSLLSMFSSPPPHAHHTLWSTFSRQLSSFF